MKKINVLGGRELLRHLLFWKDGDEVNLVNWSSVVTLAGGVSRKRWWRQLGWSGPRRGWRRGSSDSKGRRLMGQLLEGRMGDIGVRLNIMGD